MDPATRMQIVRQLNALPDLHRKQIMTLAAASSGVHVTGKEADYIRALSRQTKEAAHNDELLELLQRFPHVSKCDVIPCSGDSDSSLVIKKLKELSLADPDFRFIAELGGPEHLPNNELPVLHSKILLSQSQAFFDKTKFLLVTDASVREQGHIIITHYIIFK